MISEARQLHDRATVVIAHDHTMAGLAARRLRGEHAVFQNHYAPPMRQGGVDVIGLVIGGDRPRLGKEGADPWWGSLALMDMLWNEAEESSESLSVCLSYQDIEAALEAGKIAALALMEGCLPIDAGPFSKTMINLRTLYRLGLRGLQFRGARWSSLTNAVGDGFSSRGLSSFGEDIVREMNHLGMVIDLAHVPDPDPLFWDVLETSEAPIIDSHRGVRGGNDIPRNLSDERIRAIAENGGLIGLQFFSSTLASEPAGEATVGDLMRHIDHIVRVAGVDHVALGPDWVELNLIDRPATFYARGLEDVTCLPRVTEVLLARDYSEADIRKVLGGNLLRVYRQILGPK